MAAIIISIFKKNKIFRKIKSILNKDYMKTVVDVKRLNDYISEYDTGIEEILEEEIYNTLEPIFEERFRVKLNTQTHYIPSLRLIVLLTKKSILDNHNYFEDINSIDMQQSDISESDYLPQH